MASGAYDRGLHESDFFAWTQAQSRLLREINATRRNSLADIDIEQVAEEIEDLGRAQLEAVKSFLLQIFIHLIKTASDPDSPAARHWRTEIKLFQAQLLERHSRSMNQRTDIDVLWRRAIDIAGSALAEDDRSLPDTIPDVIPFTLEEFLAEPLDLEGMADELASPEVDSAHQQDRSPRIS